MVCMAACMATMLHLCMVLLGDSSSWQVWWTASQPVLAGSLTLLTMWRPFLGAELQGCMPQDGSCCESVHVQGF